MNSAAPLPFAVVLNRAAGRGLALRQWPRLEAELQRRHIPFTLLDTSTSQEALWAVRALPAGMPVMAVGGDGTVGALLPALVGAGRALAVVPLGSGNDFAGMLGLKAVDFAEALDRLSFAPRAVDVLEVEVVQGEHAGLKRYLLNGLGMGFDAQVNQAMLRAPARLPGFGRYAWGAIASVRDLKLIPVEIRLDGQEVYRGPSCLCAVMNGTRYGGGFLISPESDARDGLLNVVASGPIGRAQLVQLMVQVLRGQHLGRKNVHAACGREVHVTWQQPIALHMDGDDGGWLTELRAHIVPQAITLLNA